MSAALIEKVQLMTDNMSFLMPVHIRKWASVCKCLFFWKKVQLSHFNYLSQIKVLIKETVGVEVAVWGKGVQGQLDETKRACQLGLIPTQGNLLQGEQN